MPRLASPYPYEIDRATQNALIPDDAAAQGAWASLFQVRRTEVTAAFRDGRGPFAACLGLPAGGATTPAPGLGAIATACAADASAYRIAPVL
jgi:hypothetical protein